MTTHFLLVELFSFWWSLVDRRSSWDGLNSVFARAAGIVGTKGGRGAKLGRSGGYDDGVPMLHSVPNHATPYISGQVKQVPSLKQNGDALSHVLGCRTAGAIAGLPRTRNENDLRMLIRVNRASEGCVPRKSLREMLATAPSFLSDDQIHSDQGTSSCPRPRPVHSDPELESRELVFFPSRESAITPSP
jgi:hypothetical protein